jgi:hypothetical protein
MAPALLQYCTVESFQVEHQSHCWSHQNRAPQPSKHRTSEQAKDRAQTPSQDWAPGPKMLFIAALALKHAHKIIISPPPPPPHVQYITETTFVEPELQRINFGGA